MANWSRQKYFRLAKGYYRRSSNVFTVASRRVTKALQYAYIGRKQKKRIVRKEWIRTINAATREHGLAYSQFVYSLNRSNIELDRKVLAELALNEPYSFKAVVDELKDQVQVRTIKPKFSKEQALEMGLLLYSKEAPAKLRDIDFKYLRYANDEQEDYFR